MSYDMFVDLMKVLNFSPEKILYYASGGRFKRLEGKDDFEAKADL